MASSSASSSPYQRSLFEKYQIKLILEEGDRRRVTYGDSSKSGLYSEFKRVMVDGQETDYVVCDICNDNELIKYNKKQGTVYVLNHKRDHHKDVVEGPFPSFPMMKEDGPGRSVKRTMKEDGPGRSVKRTMKEDGPGRSVRRRQERAVFVRDHCVNTGKKLPSGLDIQACAYCNKEVGASAAWAAVHMKNECQLIPEEVKKLFQNPRKRLAIDDSSGDEITDDGEEDEDGDQQDKVVRILTGLLAKSGAEPSSEGKKPLGNYSDRDIDRELKELAVRKARLEVEVLQDQKRELRERADLYSEIRTGFRSIVHAANVWVDKESNSSTNTALTPRINPNILQEAYEDSITSETVNGQQS